MFKINDTILYSAEGVCKIEDITEKSFGGKSMEYYVLKPIYKDNSTVFVPVASEKLVSKMRPVLSPEEIMDIIKSMPDESTLWIDDENTRKAEYKKIITNNNPREIIQLIKTLYIKQKEQQSKGKKVHLCDERFLKDAEEVLYNEFALVLNIKPDKVLPFIIEHIEEAQ